MHAPHCTCSECTANRHSGPAHLAGNGLAFDVTDHMVAREHFPQGIIATAEALPKPTVGEQLVDAAAKTTHDIANADAIGRELIDIVRDNRRLFTIIEKAKDDLGRNYTRWGELMRAIGGDGGAGPL